MTLFNEKAFIAGATAVCFAIAAANTARAVNHDCESNNGNILINGKQVPALICASSSKSLRAAQNWAATVGGGVGTIAGLGFLGIGRKHRLPKLTQVVNPQLGVRV